MAKYKVLMTIGLMFVCFCASAHAQGLKGKLRGKLAGGSGDSTRDNQRNDFEGAVWEYKVMDRHEKDKSKRTLMVGRFRVKQSAVFAVGRVEVVNRPPELSPEEQAKDYMEKFDSDGDGGLNTNELTKLLKTMRKNESELNAAPAAGAAKDNAAKNGAGSDLKALLSDRIGRAKEEGTGSERIGDMNKKNPKSCIFNFDQDDSYPLSGRADVKPDSSQKGGVWTGNYDEYVDGKKRHRWRIELRKIDE